MATKTETKKDAGTAFRVRMTFTDEVLGTSPSDPDIYDQFIGVNAEDVDGGMSAAERRKQERDRIAETAEWEGDGEVPNTVFPRRNGEPFVWDYQVRGCFKDACGMLRRVAGTKSSKLTAYKKVIDGNIFVEPREIPIRLSGPEGKCQRPLRAQTAQGERISLASSETVPAGSQIEFDVVCMDSRLVDTVFEWLAYGADRGFGQWRNSGKGRYTAEVLDEGTGEWVMLEREKPKRWSAKQGMGLRRHS